MLRRRSLGADDLTELRGVRLAALPLAVLDTAAELGTAGAPLLDRVPFPALLAAYRRNPSTAGRRLLDAAADRSTATAVRLLVRLLRESGVGGWRGGRPSGGARGRSGAGGGIAVTFPAARVAIRVAGWSPPVDEPTAALPGPGWTVLCVSGPDLAARPGEVLAEIAAAVGRCAGSGQQ